MVATSARAPGVTVIRLAITLIDDRCGQSRQHRDSFAQRRCECDLAAHGPLRNGGDTRFLADEIGKFVDAFLADHGGIHVGEQQSLAPSRRRLHDDVDRRIAKRFAQPIRNGAGVDA